MLSLRAVEPGRPKQAEIDALALAETAMTDPHAPKPGTSAAEPVASVDILATESIERVAGREGVLRPFGPYTRVEHLTEQGAMGIVARGYNAAFDRWELLKFLRPDFLSQPEFVRQFVREGRVLAKLSHPNIVQVFATYALDGRPCLAMEFLEGVSLAAHVTKERATVAGWHELFLAAARGLAAAHDVGLLHRDIKPENLFVVHDRAGAPKTLKLIDFGLATADRRRHADPTHDPTLVAAFSGGTPLYQAPELWLKEEASPRTDIYALGQSFFFALTGRLPFVGETVAQVFTAVCANEPFPDAREMRPDLPAPLALVLRRCIAKRKDERFSTADELVAALVTAASAARPRRVPGSGPYRGLGSYSAAERDVFFGRETEVAEVLEHLRTQSAVVLVGPGGSGKSSLAHAGVMPAIEEGALGGGVAYGSVLLEPRAHPIQSLAAALARRLGSAEKDVLAFLGATPARLGEALRAALPPDAGVVLVIDQLEELATLATDPSEVHAFAVAVGSLIEVGSSPVRVVATLRADLMDRLFAFEPLRPLLTRGFYPVRPLGGDALRQAMTGPALAADYRLEDPRIIEAVIDDVARTPSGLPLLSFAMAAWWEARDEATRTLPTAAWTALGGLTGALTRHGDRVLETMSDEARGLADQILVRLVSADRTRTRVSRASLLDPAASGPGAAPVLERLLQARLVHESSGDLELVHEALITQWPRLRELLVSSGEDRAFRERVSAAARQWHAQDRPEGSLWTGDQAMRLARWFSATNAPLDQLDLAFIEAVRRRARRKQAAWRLGTTAVVLVALSYGLVAHSNARELQRRLDAANASLKDRKAAYVRAETGRLNELAAFELERDPGATLRHAAASYELLHDPMLDVLAWNARSLGLAIALPGLKGAVTLVRASPGADWIAAAGGGTVELLATASSRHLSLPAQPGTAGLPTALAFSEEKQTLALGSSTGEISYGSASGAISPRHAPAYETTALDMGSAGRCEGAVGQLVLSKGESIFALCRPASGPARVVWVGAGSRASRPVFEGAIAAMAFARGADALVIASADGRFFRVDASSGESTPGPVVPALDDITSLDVSPGGDTAFVGESSGAAVALKLVTASKPTPAVLTHRPAGVLRIGYGPAGEMIAIDSNRTAEIRVEGHAKAFEIQVGAPAFAWVPRRHAVALVARTGEVLLVSLAALEVIGKMPSPGHEIVSLDADSNGQWLLAGATDGAVQAFNLEQGTVAVTQGSAEPHRTCALSTDGDAVGCAAAAAVVVRFVERSKSAAREPTSVALAGSPELLALGPGGRPSYAVTGGIVTLDGHTAPRLLGSTAMIVPSGDRVALAGTSSDGRSSVVVARLDLEAPLPSSTLATPVTALAWAASGARLLVATADGVVRTLEPSQRGLTEVTSIVVPGGDPIRVLSGSDDGRTIAIGTSSGKVLVVPAGGGALRTLAELHAPVACLDVAHAGRAVLASADRRVFVLDGDTAKSFVLWTTSSPVAHCSRSPGEDRFSFVDDDGTTWLKALDLAGVSESYIPVDAAVPTLDDWKGLPVGLIP
jgi:WD40 repeat protein/tRNA A-37 threonylcarbamoyl transferase component Bud32